MVLENKAFGKFIDGTFDRGILYREDESISKVSFYSLQGKRTSEGGEAALPFP